MKMFSLDKDYNVVWEPQILLLSPFLALMKRDKTKDKNKANCELAFVWFYSDIKSDYQIHTDPDVRIKAIAADMPGLPNKWVPDLVVMTAVKFYEENSTSVTASILKDGMYIANKLSAKMKESVDGTDALDVGEIIKLLDGVKKIPDIIKALQAAEKAVLQEIMESQDKMGSKEKALFEDGI
jgi:hypothetical protein